jgi:general secretion pathway protein D
VVVRDGQPVVIGGLIRDSESEGVSKIPFLGDIPVIGYLFRSTVKSTEKKNLLMVIIPTVIGDPSDLKRLHEQRVDEMREFADELATKKKEYLGEVDYRKKSGVLEEMYKVVSDARAERELLESTTFDRNGLDMVGPPETHEIEYDPYRSGRVEAEEVTPVEAVPVNPAPAQEPVQEPTQESTPEPSTDGEQAETPSEPLSEESDVDQVNPQDGE